MDGWDGVLGLCGGGFCGLGCCRVVGGMSIGVGVGGVGCWTAGALKELDVF